MHPPVVNQFFKEAAKAFHETKTLSFGHPIGDWAEFMRTCTIFAETEGISVSEAHKMIENWYEMFGKHIDFYGD